MRHAAISFMIAVLGGALVALQIFLRGEVWHERTYLIVALCAFGALAGAGVTRLASRRLARLQPRILQKAGVIALFSGVFLLVMGCAYVYLTLVATGEFEPDRGHRTMAWLSSSIQVFGLFLISVPTYLLPIPLPVLMLAAYWFLGPSPRNEVGVEPPAKRV